MKYSTFIAALQLLQLAAAQPHRRRHAHEHNLAKKDGNSVVTVVNTVYVDQNGNPIAPAALAAVQKPAPAAPAPAPAPVAPNAAKNPAPAPAPPPAAPAKPNPAPPSTSTHSTGAAGFGLVYSPYKANGECKSLADVQQDFKSISNEYKLIRTYGTDCNQVANVLAVVKERKNKFFAGIFSLANLEEQVGVITAAANGDWSNFDTVSVGNELVNGGADPAAVVQAIGHVRGLLRAAGYTGSVVTVDTLVAARANPSLCDASDYCAVNCHPYFDGNVAAADSGNFLTTQIPTLREKLANKSKKIVITETGWPWQGASNKAAVASIPNQAAAIGSIKQAFASNPEGVILFTAYNDMWKKNTHNQFDAEQFWGMGGTSSPSG